MKVVIMNHSTDFEMETVTGNGIAPVVLTRYETPDIIEITELDSTACAASGFGSSGL